MSIITLFPWLTKWGSGLRLDKEVLQKVSEPHNHADKGREEDVFLAKTQRKKKTQRHRISYWSDEDNFINIMNSR